MTLSTETQRILEMVANRVRQCVNQPSGEFLPLRFANLLELDAREAARSASGAEFSELHTTRVHVAPAPAETAPPHSWSYINTLIGWTCRHCGIADRGPHHRLPISGCSRPASVPTTPDAAQVPKGMEDVERGAECPKAPTPLEAVNLSPETKLAIAALGKKADHLRAAAIGSELRRAIDYFHARCVTMANPSTHPHQGKHWAALRAFLESRLGDLDLPTDGKPVDAIQDEIDTLAAADGFELCCLCLCADFCRKQKQCNREKVEGYRPTPVGPSPVPTPPDASPPTMTASEAIGEINARKRRGERTDDLGTTTGESGLLRCPFCEGVSTVGEDGSEHWVYCMDCGARGPSSFSDEAIAIMGWNCRASTPRAMEEDGNTPPAPTVDGVIRQWDIEVRNWQQRCNELRTRAEKAEEVVKIARELSAYYEGRRISRLSIYLSPLVKRLSIALTRLRSTATQADGGTK